VFKLRYMQKIDEKRFAKRFRKKSLEDQIEKCWFFDQIIASYILSLNQ